MRRNPDCFLAEFGVLESGSMTLCSGPLIRAHLLPQQLLKREGHKEAIWDERSWVLACGGIMGNAGHHGMLDMSRTLRLPYERLPGGLLELAEELGLLWWVEREYQTTGGSMSSLRAEVDAAKAEQESASIAQRAASHTEVDPQENMFDVVLTHDVLEAALERRQKAAEKLKGPQKEYSDADAAAKGMIAGLEEVTSFDPETDEPLTIRVGNYRIRYAAVGERSVSFTTGASTRTSIKKLD